MVRAGGWGRWVCPWAQRSRLDWEQPPHLVGYEGAVKGHQSNVSSLLSLFPSSDAAQFLGIR